MENIISTIQSLHFNKIILFLCLLLVANPVECTSVLGISLDEMLQNSEFVFEGRVTNVESRMTQNGKYIHTFVTFEIIQIIKGNYAGKKIELSFAGGTVKNLTLHIDDMDVPKLGETGIYFVESLSRRQVHPLYGWSQGHLLIEKDSSGVDRVTTRRKKRVMAIERADVHLHRQLSNGVAAGLVVKEGIKGPGGMTRSQFIKELKDRLSKP